MEQVQIYSSILVSYLHWFVYILEQTFLKWTQDIYFPLFCIIYSGLLVFLLKRLGQTHKFRPKNKQLINWKTYYKQALTKKIMNLPIIKQRSKQRIDKQFQKLDDHLMIQFQKKRDPKKALKLPPSGMNQDNLRRRINQWYAKQLKNIQTGKISGALYLFDANYYQELSDFAGKYMYHNPLHLDTYKQLIRMQSQVLKMTASLISSKPQQNAHGVLTSGGSQSLIMALFAYKNYYSNRTKPNIVVPNSVHAAVDKGCFYFNIQVRKAKLQQNFQVDLKHLQSMIDSNTILIIGSYPNYPHGIIDPIQQMAILGLQYDIGVHIDGCLGGFVAAFDQEHRKVFNIERQGITSISLDQHKFGLAPKGISTVLFKTKQLRHSMYYIKTDWCGGLYGTPSFCGSRNGFASAGAWYAFTRNTKKLYKQNTKQIIKATLQTAQKLRKIPGIKIFGEPKLCVLAFSSEQPSALDLCSFLNKQKGYQISPIHLPNGIHISMTMANCQKIKNELATDIVQGFQFLKKNPPKQSASSAVYGATSKLPTSQVGDDFLKVIIGSTLK